MTYSIGNNEWLSSISLQALYVYILYLNINFTYFRLFYCLAPARQITQNLDNKNGKKKQNKEQTRKKGNIMHDYYNQIKAPKHHKQLNQQ